jgi:protein gp37
MGKDTTISWCDSSVNPTMGCDGCELWNDHEKTCYAGKLHDRYGGVNRGFSPTFEQLTLHPGRMAKAAAWSDLRGARREAKPWLNGMPRLIFVSDMSDALSRDVPFEYLKSEVVENVTSTKGRRHQWLWLTKQPARMRKFDQYLEGLGIGWPRNLWAGTSVTTQPTVARVRELIQVRARIRFVSAEPLRGPIDLSELLAIRVIWGASSFGKTTPLTETEPAVKLVIAGGESGNSAHPCDIGWLRSLQHQCLSAGVACHIKQLGDRCIQNGVHVPVRDSGGEDWSEWPDSLIDLRMRQMPRSA